MIKVLYTVNGLRVNGMSSVIMQYISGLSKKKYQFVIFTDEVAEQYIEIIRQNNVKLITSEKRRNNQFAYFRELCSVIKKENIDIIHAHGNSATLAVEMLAATICGVKIRIAHSHNTTCEHVLWDKFLRPLFNLTYTQGIGCGVEAGKWLFGNKDHEVIKNGISLLNFKYNVEARNKIRNELNLDDSVCVVGHVGRFTDQKNHEAIVRIYNRFIKGNRHALLLLVGDGPQIEDIKALTCKLGIADKVRFYGTTSNVAALYSAMDIFLFPSKFEGVPLTLIEAQANGLPCFISNKISSEVIRTDLVTVLDLDAEDKWAETLSFCRNSRNKDSIEAITQLTKDGFEISEVLKQVDELYSKTIALR